MMIFSKTKLGGALQKSTGKCRTFTFQTLLLMCLIVLVASEILDSLSVRDAFSTFVKKYNKTYANETEEYEHRFTIFKKTLDRIANLNYVRNHTSALYGVTEFADLTPEEFSSKVLSLHGFLTGTKSLRMSTLNMIQRSKRSIQTTANRSAKGNVPVKFDWRDQKVVTPVKNQEDCGGCWALSTVETIETMYAINTGQVPILSSQQIIDCAGNGNYGCQGGDIRAALEWMNSTKVHILTESEYPFTAKTGTCQAKSPTHGIQVADFSWGDYINNEYEMVNLIANHGPVAVAVDATMWQDYLGGIIKYHCETMHNHAVQIVGYDLTGPIPYFVVRNSWGPGFGHDGYLNIEIGKNLCGISREVASVDVM